MKKLFLLILVGILLFGCSQPQPPSLSKVLTQAIEARNPAVCTSSNLSKADERTCFYSYAFDSSDATVCDNIEYVANDLSSRSGCYLDVARKTGAAELCGRIALNEGEDESQLRNFCYYEVGVKNKDATVCDKMSSDYEKCGKCPEGAQCIGCRRLTKEECLRKASEG